MRQMAAILLFLTLLLPAMAFFGSMLTLRIQIRQEVKRSLSDLKGYEEELVLVKIPKAVEESSGKNFIRFDDGEFFYEGTMYDVVRSENKPEETWYWCYRDIEETLMVAKAFSIVNQLFGTEQDKGTQRMSLQVFFPQFIAQSTFQWPTLHPIELDSNTSPEKRVQVPDGYEAPPFIPPAFG